MFEGVLLLFPYLGNIITKECQNFNDECVFLSYLICLSICCHYILQRSLPIKLRVYQNH